MSQTVLIKIVTKDDDGKSKDLASIFYRWGGYTAPCVELLSNMIAFINSNDKDSFKDEQLYAIKMLEEIEGRMDENNLEDAKKLYPDEEFESNDEDDEEVGSIIIGDENIKEYEQMSEFKIVFDLLSESINFGVIGSMSYETYEEEWACEDLEEADFYMDFSDMSFDELAEFGDFVDDNLDGVYFSMEDDESRVFYIIA